MQPVERGARDVVRFRKNAVVEFLMMRGPFTPNDLAALTFPEDDVEQFQQLLGWSVSECPDQSPGTREASQLLAEHLDDPSPVVESSEDYRAGFDDGYQRGIDAAREALEALTKGEA